MNTWAIVRVVLVAAAFLQTALSNRSFAPAEGVTVPLLVIVFGFGIIALLLVIGVQRLNPYSAPTWRYPSWSVSPFSLREPLQFFHFCGFFFLAGGVGGAVGQVLRGQQLGLTNLFLPAFGAGILCGVYACTLIYRGKMTSS